MSSTQSTVPTTTTDLPVWNVDTKHSSVEFSVRHMVISTFTGKFTEFEADIHFDQANPVVSWVNARVAVASVDTGNDQREAHLRSDDFFNAEQFPYMTFRSTKVAHDGDDYKIYGDLTIRDVTKSVVLEAEYGGTVADPWGNQRAGFAAETTINRREFGLNWNAAIEAGGAVVADKVKIRLHIEAVRAK